MHERGGEEEESERQSEVPLCTGIITIVGISREMGKRQ